MRVPAFFAVLLLSVSVRAETLNVVLAPQAGLVYAGGPMVFSVYLHNEGDEAIPVDLPNRLTCRLKGASQEAEVRADALEPRQESCVRIEPRRFVRARYVLHVPPCLEGPTRLEADELDGPGVLVDVLPEPGMVAQPEDAETLETELPTFDAVAALYQPYLLNLSAYEPMYFLMGTDPKKSKFQFGFKYRFFNPEGLLARKIPWAKGFHFAYTQTSFWDLKSASRPFQDTSYKPELFFLSSNVGADLPWVKGIFLQFGYQHESNGRGPDLSRSTNHLYGRPILVFYHASSRLGMMIAPKAWVYVANDDETNPDLDRFRGYFDLEIKFGKADSLVVGTHLRWARKGPSVQTDVTYPISRLLSDSFDLYVQFQYVNALAEKLINYRERTEAFRLGFSIVR